ncbi:MAG: LPS export ABC transporter ATP-binding protein [Phycisphaeraceae bacterium]|nr:LPS export ABC transporter ATP-binding protein [Phycisphaeraceae bacterium]
MALLKVENLTKKYGNRTVVDQIQFHVNPGEIVGLLGRNGAGKTTSFRMAIGMVTPNAGTVHFNDRDVSRLPMHRRARLGMGYLSQEPSIFQRMTVEKNLLAILETRKLTKSQRLERAESLMERFGLLKVRRQKAHTISGGERRKLEIARALSTEPTLILLDEPFYGVDPIAVEELQHEIERLRGDQNIAMLITDHNVERTLEVCDRAYIMHEGKVLRDGAPRDLINDELVRKTYLGHTFRGDEFD